MVCNEVQWSATIRRKEFYFLQNSIGCRWRKSFTTFFAKKITNSQTFLLMPFYTIYECLILKNKDNARKNFII